MDTNKNVKEILCGIIEMMDQQQHLKIENNPFMPLTIEKIEAGILTPWGSGTLFSLCHYYQQNGDLMQDPEMCFIVVDKRTSETTDVDFVSVYPYMFQQASLSTFQESILIENGKITKYKKSMQADHTIFANQWLRNIKQQGYLKGH